LILYFLQHGIIKDDLSKYLNRFRTNISLFITSSEKEYKSILNSNYGYNENNIILTGLPRFDNLQRLHNLINKEKIVLILPTWRMYIKGTYDSKRYKSIIGIFCWWYMSIPLIRRINLYIFIHI